MQTLLEAMDKSDQQLSNREKSLMYSAVVVAVCAFVGVVSFLGLVVWKLLAM